jgi:DNA polymerase-1
MSKLVLIDGNAIMYRAFHALPPMTNKKGEPTNAIYGLVSMVLRVIQDLKPTHIAVCFDEKAPTFRRKEYAKYQAQRPPMPGELSSQFDKARQFFFAVGIPVYSMEGFEADDLIGTIADKSKEDVVIITGDRDQLQLVNKKVKLYMPIAGLSNAKLFGEQETLERMGVSATLIDDYKALVGDPSDNYPGVPGIGPKTAVSLLEKFGTFEDIYKNLDKISASVGAKLKAGEKLGRLSKRLATIVRDVPFEFDFEKMDDWDIDSDKVLKLFNEFGFKTLTERIKKVGREIDAEKQMTLI